MLTESAFPVVLIWLAIGLAASLGTYWIQSKLTTASNLYLESGYRVLIPYLGLITGSISPYLMGLSNINWATSLGIGVGLFFAILAILALMNATLLYGPNREQQPNRASTTPLVERQLRQNLQAPLLNNISVRRAVSAVTEQFYWTFIRAAVWEALITVQPQFELPAYHALWLAALFAIPDTLMHTANAQARINSVCTFIATSILFFYTRNFWICALLHLAMAFLLRQNYADAIAPTAASQSQSLRQIESRIR